MTKDEALRLALQALKETWYHVGTFSPTDEAIELYDKAIRAIKEALETKDEPVAWMNDSTPSGIFARHIEGAKNFGCTIPLYTTQKRTWVGLTDEDKQKLVAEHHDWESLYFAIQAKLKERNI